jgi:integrase/recombinase XerD
VELLYYSAGRITEVRSLRWGDLTDDGIVFRTTKNGHERLVPWSPGLRGAVEGLREHFGEGRLVLPRSAQTIALWLSRAGVAAGVEGVHPHLFRSTAATRMLVGGARPHAVRDVLGHAKLTTTQVYFAVEHTDKVAAVQVL